MEDLGLLFIETMSPLASSRQPCGVPLWLMRLCLGHNLHHPRLLGSRTGVHHLEAPNSTLLPEETPLASYYGIGLVAMRSVVTFRAVD